MQSIYLQKKGAIKNIAIDIFAKEDLDQLSKWRYCGRFFAKEDFAINIFAKKDIAIDFYAKEDVAIDIFAKGENAIDIFAK